MTRRILALIRELFGIIAHDLPFMRGSVRSSIELMEQHLALDCTMCKTRMARE